MQKIVNWIVLFDINIIIITPGEYGSRFEVLRNTLGDTANTPNTSEICTSESFHLEAFWRQRYTLQDIFAFCCIISEVFRSTGEVVSEHPRAYCFAFSLSGSIWEHLEESVWLFIVAELFSYDFKTIIHFADHCKSNTRNALWLWNPQNHCCENTALCLPQSCTDVLSCSQSLSCSKVWLAYQSTIVASWMHLHNCRCFQEQLTMLFQSWRVRCLAPWGPGSIWNHLWAPVRSTGVSRVFVCGFRTDLHFADVGDIEYMHQNLRHSSLIRGNPATVAGICWKFRCTGESRGHILMTVTA